CRVTKETGQALELCVTQFVLDIIPKIPGADRLERRIAEVGAGDTFGLAGAGVPRFLKGQHVGRRHRIRPPRPERIDEWQTRELRPGLAQIDLLDVLRS